MEQPLCLYRGKLKEALTLVVSMSQDKHAEAVAYWNAYATQMDKIINPNPGIPITNDERPGTPSKNLDNYTNHASPENNQCEINIMSTASSNAITNSPLNTPFIKQTPSEMLLRNEDMDRASTYENVLSVESNPLSDAGMFNSPSSDRVAQEIAREAIDSLPDLPMADLSDDDIFCPNRNDLARSDSDPNMINLQRDGPNNQCPSNIDDDYLDLSMTNNDINYARYDNDVKTFDEDVAGPNNSESIAQTTTLDPSTSNRDELFTQKDRPLQQIQLFTNSRPNSFLNQTHTSNGISRQNYCNECHTNLSSNEELDKHEELHYQERCTLVGDDVEDPLNILEVKREIVNKITIADANECEICGKSGFSTKGNLKRHLRAHSGEKPFKCEHCKSCFTEKKSLKIHVRRHTGEKPYKCNICDKLFSQTGVLQSHMALHLDERKFECEKCKKAFRQRSQLKLHLMRHDGVKRLECATCMAKFLTKGDLERHRRIHTGERPYSCEMCEKTFTRQQSLNEHMNRHMNRKPYDCKQCNKTFSEMSACYKHVKTHRRQESLNQTVQTISHIPPKD